MKRGVVSASCDCIAGPGKNGALIKSKWQYL